MPGAVDSFVRGFTKPVAALRFLMTRRGVRRFAVLPLLVNLFVYLIVIALFVWLLANWDLSVGEWNFWGGVGAILSDIINFILGPLKWLIAIPIILLTCYFTFSVVGMIIASPFNDMLSERVERAITQQRDDVKLPLATTGKLMTLGVWDGIVILGRQLIWMLVALPLAFVLPILGWVPLFLVVAYFSGLGYFDYSMARNYLRNRHKNPVIRNHRWSMLGLGVAMECLFLIPFLNLLILPLGVVAGTMLYCEIDWEKELAEAGLEKPLGFIPPKLEHSGPEQTQPA